MMLLLRLLCLLILIAATGCETKDKSSSNSDTSEIIEEGSCAGLSQQEFTEPAPLLNSDGSLASWGWARNAMIEYNREDISAEVSDSLKEWEFYGVITPKIYLSLTIANISWMILVGLEFNNLETGEKFTNGIIAFTEDTVLDLPLTPYGNLVFAKDGYYLSFNYIDGRRELDFSAPKNIIGPGFSGHIVAREECPAPGNCTTS
jgi:uncharacterized protein DUF2804